MGAFGLSDKGQDSRGQMDELNYWLLEQAKQWWGEQNNNRPTAAELQQFVTERLKERFGEGFGSPEDIRALSERIMPGVDEAIANRQQRTDALRTQAGQIPNAGQVRNDLNTITDEQGQSITQHSDANEGLINDGYGGMKKSADLTGQDIVSNIGDSFSAADKNATNIYNEQRGATDSTYGGIMDNIGSGYGEARGLTKQGIGEARGNVGSAFGEARENVASTFGEADTNVDRLGPNGEFRASRVGRSYAPALASTAMRLRRSGVGAGSPEYNAAMQKVEGMRSRGMDDAYADENRYFVDAKNRVLKDRLASDNPLVLGKASADNDLIMSGLGMDRSDTLGKMRDTNTASKGQLDTNLGLMSDQKNLAVDLALGKGEEFRNEKIRQLGTDMGLSEGQMQALLKNADTTFGRTETYQNNRRGDIATGRNLAVDDLGIQTGLEDRSNTDDLVGFDLKNTQFQLGNQNRGQNLAVTGEALNNLNQVGNEAFDRSVKAGQMGGTNAVAAQRGFGDTLGREAANAGWGKKLIGGLAGTAANLFLPGSGGFVSGMFGGGQQGGGGFGAPIPISGSWRNPWGSGGLSQGADPWSTTSQQRTGWN